MIRILSKIIVLCYLPLCVLTQETHIFVEKVPPGSGLPDCFIYEILQDHRGYIWICSEAGLYRYDGYNFKKYSHDPDNKYTIGSNAATAIFEDEADTLWVGTLGGGLNKYNRDTEFFERFVHNPNDSNSISKNDISSIVKDQSGLLWLGSLFSMGIDRYDPVNGIFKRYYYSSDDSLSIPDTQIRSIYVDKEGEMWLGTAWGPGLLKFDRENNNFIRFPQIEKRYNIETFFEDTTGVLWLGTLNGLLEFNKQKKSFRYYEIDKKIIKTAGNTVRQILKDRPNILWLAHHNGLLKFNIKSKKYSYLKLFSKDGSILEKPRIWSICKDNSNTLWIGTSTGLYRYNPHKEVFNNYKQDIINYGGLQCNDIRGILEDKSGRIWFGTAKAGLYIINPFTGAITNIKRNPNVQNSFAGGAIMSLHESKEGLIWIGSNRINIYDPKSKQFENIHNNTGKSIEKYRFVAMTVCETNQKEKDFLWFGTPNGMIKLDIQTKKMITYLHDSKDKNSLSDNYVAKIFEDQDGFLWIATLNGLNRFNPKTDQFTRYYHDPENLSSISNNTIWTIYGTYDKGRQILWFGTSGGLNRFDPVSGTFKRYTEKNGLVNNSVQSILEDNQHNLWLGTKSGLSRFTIKTEKFKNYDIQDGLAGNSIAHSCFKTRSGELLFGSKTGLIAFNPDKIKENSNIPPIVITDFFLFNNPVPVNPFQARQDKDFYLPKSISELSELTLSHENNFFTFEFAALDFRNPMKNKFAYKMKGIDKFWNKTDASRRYATYTDVSPGEYVFRVKGSNNDGVWNEEGASVKIKILPPWWRTTLAYGLYTILFLTILYSFWMYDRRRQRLKQELVMEHRLAEQYQEIDRLKSRFFANISHEFRTPLTLILSPVEQLINERFKGNLKEGYQTIRSNAKKLLRLVNQLLSLSKLEAGQMHLQVSEKDIIPVIRRIINLFSSLAERKNVSFTCNFPDSLTLYFDEEKMETVLNNLLSNAFKFTPEGGVVTVKIDTPLPTASPLYRGEINTPMQSASEDPPHSPPLVKGGKQAGIEISVSNTGSYIPEDQIEKIFDRFYQLESNHHVQGTGIGLSLAKDLIELHHGRITVQSKKGEKTTFSVFIPAHKDHYSADEITDPGEKERRDDEYLAYSETHAVPAEPEPSLNPEYPKILIVEDNEEVRHYLKNNLRDTYNIFEAANGKTGIEVAKKELPDLIISDVMMPEMDGFAFCDKVKSDILTCHIPVILLTARAETEDKIEGLKTGADDYLPKPFDLEELTVRITNLIQQRNVLKQRFSKEALFGIDNISMHSAEQQFVEKVINVVSDHIDRAEYSVEDFAKDLGLSRTQLFRKIKVWTDLTPNEFIKLSRLKKAAELLKTTSLNVSEIAFEVGFKNISHFIQSFKQQFGITPKEFIES